MPENDRPHSRHQKQGPQPFVSTRAHLCQCSKCSQVRSPHPDTGELFYGRFMGRKERDHHSRRDTQNGVVPPLARTEEAVFFHPETSNAIDPNSESSMLPDGKAAMRTVESDHGTIALGGGRVNQDNIRSSQILDDLQQTQDALEHKRSLAMEHNAYSYSSPPTRASVPIVLQPVRTQPREVNQGPFALRYDQSQNGPLLLYEEWLLEILMKLDMYKTHSSVHVRLRTSILLDRLEDALAEVENWKMAEWERQRCAIKRRDPPASTANTGNALQEITTDVFLQSSTAQLDPLVLLCYLLVATLHLLCRVSIKRCVFVLASMRLVLQLALGRNQSPGDDTGSIIDSIPSDVRTLLQCMDVLPVTRSFVCCPGCFALYPLDEANTYPDRCNARRAPLSAPCNVQLRLSSAIKGITTTFPTRGFIYQDIKHWLGRQLCRPGLEELMDKSLRHSSTSIPSHCGDIYDTSTIRNLLGTDGEKFISMNHGEGRYIFSLCMDGLQPRGKGGPPESVGAIYLACLNLPPNMRYHIDNMFLAGIIPGPRHPHLDEINSLVAPLVDDFVVLWYRGVRYSKTPLHPKGKTVKCAIVPLVCDLLAARQMAGFAGHSHTWFCSFCYRALADIENLEWWNWSVRTCDKHRRDAERWRLAQNESERLSIYNETGVRWSELLRLPYWDPVKFTALDPMHALFLNGFRTHVEDVWGISAHIQDDLLGVTYDTGKRPPKSGEMQAAYVVLKTGSKTSLDRLRVDVLRQLCKEQGLRFAGVKDALLSRLHELRRTRGWVDLDGRPTQGQAITECLDPLQEDLLIEALEAVEARGQSVLNRFPVSVLRRACAEICGGIRDDYISWSKDELLGRLYEYRVQKGIISDGGLLLQRQGATARREVPTPLEVERGLRVLENGSKTDLSRLTVNVLAELCARNLADGTFEQYRNHKKSDLLEKLHHYRDVRGLGETAKQQAAVLTKMQSLLNISRTNSVVSLSVGGGLRVVSAQGQYITAEELANAEDILERGGKTKFNKLSTAALLTLYSTRLAMDNVDALQREGALVALHRYRVDNAITTEEGILLEKHRRVGKKGRVLGQKTLERVWEDFDNLVLPSWVTRPPRRMGSAKKTGGLGFGADEWRTFCTVNLAGTLIYAWGSLPPESREAKLLLNFMDLVTAVN